MEFEHLKKDEHPDPPLRALPEHSIAGEKEVSAAHAPIGSDGANDGPAEKDFAATSQSTLSEAEQVQAGKTTFNVPVFGDDSAADKQAVGDELSPTQSTT